MLDPYVTCHFPDSGEECMVPKSLIDQSPHLKDLLENSHNNEIIINGIAFETFHELVHLLKDRHPSYNKDHIPAMVELADKLGLKDPRVKVITSLFQERLRLANPEQQGEAESGSAPAA